MLEPAILQELGLIVLGAAALGLFARTVRVPAIVGYILSGLLLGPLLGFVEVTDALEVISEVGIILLLFLVGLELSLDKIREVGAVALAAGTVQVVTTGILVALIVAAFGRPTGEILFLAVALTFSSTVVVVKLLDQSHALDSRHGRLAVGVLLVQDLVVVLVLTIVAGLGGGDEMTPGTLAMDLGLAFGGTGLILLVAAVAARWLLPALFGQVAGSQQTLLIWALAWCFLLVFISHQLHLSVELGAFVAGVSLAQLPYNHDLRRRVHPLMNFFVAVFFVTLGLQMELGAAVDAWPLVLALVAFTLFLKPPLIAHLVRRGGETPRIALRTGLTLGQTSEFSFILAALALANGLVDPELLSIVAAVGLVTMGISSFSILNGSALADLIADRGLMKWLTGGDGRGDSDDPASPIPERHVVVVGMNTLGRTLVHALADMGVPVVAVDTDPQKLADLPSRTVLGNAEYLSVLEEVDLAGARLLVSTLQIEDTNRLLAFRARAMGVPAAIHALDAESERELGELGVLHLMNSREAGMKELSERLRTYGAFGS